MTSRLRTENLKLGYGKTTVLEGLSLDFPDGKITAIVGPNACGKSTLLRCLARLIKPMAGQATLDGTPVHKQNTKTVAKAVALLPQSAAAPQGMRVVDLVARGRTPHQTPLQQWSAKDADVVRDALAKVGLADEAERDLEDLSGGQRQRAWIAMVLAQETDILLLDEPTTFLDLRYQIETLKLVRQLQLDRNLTVVMVLHDINLAARFADHIVALRDKGVVVQGTPSEVVTEGNIQAVYDMPATVIDQPGGTAPHVIPH